MEARAVARRAKPEVTRILPLKPLGYAVIEWPHGREGLPHGAREVDEPIVWAYARTEKAAREEAYGHLEDDYPRCRHCGEFDVEPPIEVVRVCRYAVELDLDGYSFDTLLWDWDLCAYRYAQEADCVVCHGRFNARCDACSYGRQEGVRNNVNAVCNLDPGFAGRALLRFVANMAGEKPLV